MKKIFEHNNNGLILKCYRETGFNSAVDFINFIINKYGDISNITISEFTDYKTFDGLPFTYDELLKKYNEIISEGENVSFRFECIFNSVPVRLKVSADGDNISIMYNVINIELEDIIE